MARACIVPDCHTKHYAVSYCRRHYAQIKRRGSLNGKPNQRNKRHAVIEGNVAKIYLSNGEYTLVDVEYANLDIYKWNKSSRYAKCSSLDIQLHRYITHVGDDEVVDHINGNGLDNRLVNLRICKQMDNLHNVGLSSKNTSGYKGVSLHQQTGKYHVQITNNGTRHSEGLYNDIEEAAKAYNRAALKYHGEFAFQNEV